LLHTEGLSYLLEDDPDRADPIFARAFDAAISSGALPLAALVLAERCVVAAARDDWPYVVMLAKRAMQIVHEGGFEDYWTSSLVFAWAARSAARRSDIASARRYLTQATRLRPLLTHALPAVSVQTLLELARAYIALADPGGAAAVLEQAGDILAQRPDLGTLVTDARDLRGTVAAINQEAIGASALTPAELRVLPLLATHLSLPEIAEQLTVSFHTVKSHAHSIYQKLGVSSRSQAVTRSHELGLADL
jgi:LuxR family maltose regulon positive regulatory protein